MWAGCGYEVDPGKDKNEKVKRDAATQLRPARSERKKRVFVEKRQDVWFETQRVSN